MIPLLAILAGVLALAEVDARRERMVREQIESRGVRNPDVLAAMRATPRELFVPLVWQRWAYEDSPMPIGYGQTISQPYIVAKMTELLAPGAHDRVLEIGTGSGYQAAILSQLVRTVYSIEIVPELGQAARDRLEQSGYKNVLVRVGDGYKGWPEHAPFERIILTAAPPEVPPALVEQLKPGGRLVAPVGTADQEIVVIDKDPDGKVHRKAVLAVRFVPMVKGRP